jgi:hypothetical protein
MDDLDADTEGMPPATELQTQNLLRHALSESISENIINCLIITNSTEANIQLTRIHEHLFSRKSHDTKEILLMNCLLYRGSDCSLRMEETNFLGCRGFVLPRNE